MTATTPENTGTTTNTSIDTATDTTPSVWFVTGAGRGLGVHITREALAAGHSVPPSPDARCGRTSASTA